MAYQLDEIISKEEQVNVRVIQVIKNKRVLFNCMIFMTALLIMGCHGTDGVVYPPRNSSQNSTPVALRNTSSAGSPAVAKENKIALCQNELTSLKKVSPESYLRQKAYFDYLVSNAIVYTAVRSNVNMQTRDTVDALYKYKIQQICAEIERDVLQGLIRRGESLT
ncbi:TPA: hypothetical protein ACKP1B_004337 [Serratia fonticola]